MPVCCVFGPAEKRDFGARITRSRASGQRSIRSARRRRRLTARGRLRASATVCAEGRNPPSLGSRILGIVAWTVVLVGRERLS